MKVTEVLAESLRMMRERPKFVLPMLIPTILSMGILGLTIAAQIPMSGIPAEEAAAPSDWYLLSVFMLSAMTFVISTLVYGMYPSTVRDRRENRELNLKESFHLSYHRFWSLLGASLLVMIITSAIAAAISFAVIAPLAMSSSTIAVVAGIAIEGIVVFLISILFYYIPPAVIMDELKAVESIRRSWEIGKKNYLFTLLIMVVPALISGSLSGLLTGLPAALGSEYVLILLIPYAIISLFISAWTIIIPCYAYYDLRSAEG